MSYYEACAGSIFACLQIKCYCLNIKSGKFPDGSICSKGIKRKVKSRRGILCWIKELAIVLGISFVIKFCMKGLKLIA